MQKLLFSLLMFCFATSIFGQDSKLKKLKIVYRGEIYFDSGKNDLRSDAFAILDSTIFYFKKDTTQKIFLTAHADAKGSQETNQNLSQRRSQAVKEFFSQKGIAETKIHSEEFGEEKPVASNSEESGRQKNRRVTIEVSKYVTLIKVTGIVKDSLGPIAEALVFLRGNSHQDSAKTNLRGEYQLYGADREDCTISVVAKDYFIENQSIKLDIAKLKPLEFKLGTPQVGQIAALKNIYFQPSLAIFLPRSYTALKDLLLFLQINKSYKVEIDGHVNLPNTPKITQSDLNFILSVDRAKAVYNFLVKNNIEASRLAYKGFGNWNMRFPFAKTEAQQEANRRVEIKILEK
jgi:outer membrane protein OmpA-like peptidoglycan-associated protein